MKQKIIQLFLFLSLVVSLSTGIMQAQIPVNGSSSMNASSEQLDAELVYLDEETCRSIVELNHLLPDHAWSKTCKDLCTDIQNGGDVAFYRQVDSVVNECLAAIDCQRNDTLRPLQEILQNYKKTLQSGKAHVDISELDDQSQTRDCNSLNCCKAKRICKLCVGFFNGKRFILCKRR